MGPYRIVLVDDHVIVRQAIKEIIEKNDKLAVVGEASDGLELFGLLGQLVPELVILDISLPKIRGLEAAKKVKELYPQVKILILTVHNERDYLERAMSIGVDGYMLKDEGEQELYAAIQAIRQGKTYISSFFRPGP
jgi:DNA-binding NarL/FixJ family response regulator